MSIVSQARNALGRAKGYGECYRCGGTWDYTPEHSTQYENHNGTWACFPLCEVCWTGLTVDERLPYYHALVDKWISLHPAERDEYEQKRDNIIASVEAGG